MHTVGMVLGVFMTLMCSEIKDARPATDGVIVLLSPMMQSIAADDGRPGKLTLRHTPALSASRKKACRIMTKIH